MKKLLLAAAIGGLLSSTAMADAVYEYEVVPSKDKDRSVVIQMIRVTSEKTLVETEESDEEVASILEELEALDDDFVDESDDVDESS